MQSTFTATRADALMATWQFDVRLIPHREVVAGHVSSRLAPGDLAWITEEACERDWWTRHQPSATFLDAIDALLPRTETWARDTRHWGTMDGDRIDVVYRGHRVADLCVHIDLRLPDDAFIAGVARLAHDLDCDFLTAGMISRGKAGSLDLLIRNSRAYRFVEDPLAFLQRVLVGGVLDG